MSSPMAALAGASPVLPSPAPQKIPPPLGLPRHSVRATLALFLCGTLWYLTLTGEEIPNILWESVLLVVAFYFGVRSTAPTSAVPVATAGSVVDHAHVPQPTQGRRPLRPLGGVLRHRRVGVVQSRQPAGPDHLDPPGAHELRLRIHPLVDSHLACPAGGRANPCGHVAPASDRNRVVGHRRDDVRIPRVRTAQLAAEHP